VIARAFAPASVANVAVGFDILGHAIAGIGDTVSVRRIDEPRCGSRRSAAVPSRCHWTPPATPPGCADVAARRPGPGLRFRGRDRQGHSVRFRHGRFGSVECRGAGRRQCAAGCPLPREALYPFALDGEAVASGGRHGDNVGPLLLGGLALCTADRLLPIPVPASWHSLLVHPHAVLETRRARQALQGSYALGEFVAQSANLALVLSGCHRSDATLVRAGLRDAGGTATGRIDCRLRGRP
jgi:homoserine kinase